MELSLNELLLVVAALEESRNAKHASAIADLTERLYFIGEEAKAEQMSINANNKIGHPKTACPSTPYKTGIRKDAHFFEDISYKPSPNKGERLVTTRCKYCGVMQIDIPMITCY